MENVILLGTSDQFTPKAMKIMSGVMAGLFFLQVFFYFYGREFNSLDSIGSVLAGGLTLGGIYYLFLFFKGFSKSSSFAPKVRLTEQFLEFKTDFFSAKTKIDWLDIKSIEMKSYRLIFHLSNSTKEVNYTTSSYNSKEIKRGIMEFAEAKGIQVI
jgi:hypothetical protein